MGIALSGLTDGTTIANNAFLANRVHVKLGRGGNNTYIHNCDFLRFDVPEGFPRIDVWFTLTPDDTNCGGGMVITRCKFGNEFLAEGDYKILYADETEGHMIHERWPLLDHESPNWIGGHTVSTVFTNGIGDPALIPLVRSTTSNIVGSTYGPVTLAGNSGAPILSTIKPLRDGGHSNYVGPLLRANELYVAIAGASRMRPPIIMGGRAASPQCLRIFDVEIDIRLSVGRRPGSSASERLRGRDSEKTLNRRPWPYRPGTSSIFQ